MSIVYGDLSLCGMLHLVEYRQTRTWQCIYKRVHISWDPEFGNPGNVFVIILDTMFFELENWI